MPLGPQPRWPIFGRRLMFARIQQGLTQMELGTKCGITSRGQMNKLEKGTREPCMAHLAAIARTLGVTSDWLLGLSEHGGPKG